MIDIDKIEMLAKGIIAGPRAGSHVDPVIRNMGRLEFDGLCKEYGQTANPSAILELCAEVRRLRESVDKLLAHCPGPECFTCGEAVCPHGEPLHFHHDGCPSCCEAV